MAFSRPVPASSLGRSGQGEVWLASRAVPMGWVSACGVIQHIHRRLLQQPLAGLAPLPAGDEVRRDP